MNHWTDQVSRPITSHRHDSQFVTIKVHMFFLFLQILANVLPGTTLHTDEWRCYVNAATWVAPPNAPYVHETVNHSINFVDPITGCNTQRIEVCWSDFRLRLVKMMKKTRQPSSLQSYCAAEWWFLLHGEEPFRDIVVAIRWQYFQWG